MCVECGDPLEEWEKRTCASCNAQYRDEYYENQLDLERDDD